MPDQDLNLKLNIVTSDAERKVDDLGEKIRGLEKVTTEVEGDVGRTGEKAESGGGGRGYTGTGIPGAYGAIAGTAIGIGTAAAGTLLDPFLTGQERQAILEPSMGGQLAGAVADVAGAEQGAKFIAEAVRAGMAEGFREQQSVASGTRGTVTGIASHAALIGVDIPESQLRAIAMQEAAAQQRSFRAQERAVEATEWAVAQMRDADGNPYGAGVPKIDPDTFGDTLWDAIKQMLLDQATPGGDS